MLEPIQSIGDATPHLIALAKSCMVAGANPYEALNLLQGALDKIKSDAAKYLAPARTVPPEYAEELARVYGTWRASHDA
jgi:hypothetical protein